MQDTFAHSAYLGCMSARPNARAMIKYIIKNVYANLSSKFGQQYLWSFTYYVINKLLLSVIKDKPLPDSDIAVRGGGGSEIYFHFSVVSYKREC